MKKITPFLWFDDNAEEAMHLYTSLFPDAEVLETTPGPDGKVMSVRFRLQGQEFIGLNAGPRYHFSEAISFMVGCETQEEIDLLWDKLGEGGVYQSCGWLKDRYGLSWQITPTVLWDLLQDPDPARAGRAMQAMLDMEKFDIAALQKAADGK